MGLEEEEAAAVAHIRSLEDLEAEDLAEGAAEGVEGNPW